MITLGLGMSTSSQAQIKFQTKTETIDSLLATYQQHLANYPGLKATLAQNAQWQVDQEALIVEMADFEFKLFIEQNQKPTLLNSLIDPLDQARFNAELNQTALKQTLQYLSQSKSSEVQKFLNLFYAKSARTSFAFNIVRSSDFLSAQMPAGYVRGEHMVLMKYNDLDRANWLAIFVHEVSHFLDPMLDDAVKKGIVLANAHPNIGPELLAIGQKTNASQMPSADEASLVDTWITLGFDRGMMAEIRAWNSSYSLYLDLKAEGLITPVDWAEQILAQKDPDNSMLNFCKWYFNRLYVHPTTGIFIYPYLSARMEAIRAQLLQSENTSILDQ